MAEVDWDIFTVWCAAFDPRLFPLTFSVPREQAEDYTEQGLWLCCVDNFTLKHQGNTFSWLPGTCILLGGQ